MGRRLRGIGLILLLGVVSCSGTSDGELPPESRSQPDLLLFSIDTLRADHLGAYGYERNSSPFVDAMAATGSQFMDAWSPSPWTLPSHATMLSGTLPSRHGAIDQEQMMDPSIPWLAEELQKAGYRTAAFTSALFVSGRYGFARGFDYFDDAGTGGGGEAEAPDAEERLAAALRWAKAQPAGAPLFIFVHLFDVHYPYAPPSPHDQIFGRPSEGEELHYENYFHYLRAPLSEAALAQQRQQYDAEIRYVDGQLESFWRIWENSRPKAIATLTSDHGEEFGERGSWGHAHTLTREQLHIPWISWGKNIRQQRIEARHGLEDLAPTLAGLAGLDFPGINLASLLREGQRPIRTNPPAAYAETSRFNTLRMRWHEAGLDLQLDLRAPSRELLDRQEISRNDPAHARGMQGRLFDFLGEPWRIDRKAVVISDGAIVSAGRLLGARAELEAGQEFACFPADASLRLEGESSGYRAAGGPLPPVGHPLSFRGESHQGEAPPLSEAQRERLRALGYID